MYAKAIVAWSVCACVGFCATRCCIDKSKHMNKRATREEGWLLMRVQQVIIVAIVCAITMTDRHWSRYSIGVNNESTPPPLHPAISCTHRRLSDRMLCIINGDRLSCGGPQRLSVGRVWKTNMHSRECAHLDMWFAHEQRAVRRCLCDLSCSNPASNNRCERVCVCGARYFSTVVFVCVHVFFVSLSLLAVTFTYQSGLLPGRLRCWDAAMRRCGACVRDDGDVHDLRRLYASAKVTCLH